MIIPSFEYLLRDAPMPESRQRFIAALLATERFVRNEKSQILFVVNLPRDFCLVERWQGLQDILTSGEVMRITGDVSGSIWQDLWMWLTAAKWRLPRANPHVPYSPEKPAPVRNAGRGPWVRS